MDDVSPFEPTLISAVWRYKWLVAAIVAAAGFLAVFYVQTRPVLYRAVATIVVEDPRSSALFGDSGTALRPERYVADQVEILSSPEVAARAADVAVAADQALLTVDDVLDGLVIVADGTTDQIEIRFWAVDGETAQTGANSVAQAYQDIRREAATRDALAARDLLDSAIADLDDEVAAVEAEIAALRGFGDNAVLDQQFGEAIVELSEIQGRLAAGTGSAEAQAADRARLADLQALLLSLESIRRIQAQEPGLVALLAEQEAALNLRADLQSRRNEISIEVELANDGVAYFSPAQGGEPASSGRARPLAVALVLGGLLGTGLAYLLALRKRTFSSRLEPAALLGASLLADVPDFSAEGVKSPLPVRDAPQSVSAESFRFAATALGIHMASEGHRVFIAASSTQGGGKTTVLGNMALAAAREGRSVLVIDADFGDQAASRMLIGSLPDRGLADVAQAGGLERLVESGVSRDSVLRTVWVGDGASFRLIGRGERRVMSPDFFTQPAVVEFFREVRELFDVILIDGPPLLQVAYASVLARFADEAVVVVEHGSPVGQLEEVVQRLEFIDKPIAGYVYNRAPLRSEMTGSKGSLMFVRSSEPVTRRGRRRREKTKNGEAVSTPRR